MNTSRRVFMTGTSAGFGNGTAKALAARGHTVYATMRGVSGKNADKAQALKNWATETGYKVHILELDVMDEASVKRAVNDAIEIGGIDVLINNAGMGTWGIDEGYTVEQAQLLFDTNIFGMIRMNRAVVPYFRKAGKGVIIYISSGLGRIVLPFMALYTASKFAVEGYAQSVDCELAPLGIQSVIIEPGAYGTTFLEHSVRSKNDPLDNYGVTATMFKAFSGSFEERAKSGGLGNPIEVVDAVVEEVERSARQRPLRRTVGRDVQESVSAINKTSDQIQDHLMTAFGMKKK